MSGESRKVTLMTLDLGLWTNRNLRKLTAEGKEYEPRCRLQLCRRLPVRRSGQLRVRRKRSLTSHPISAAPPSIARSHQSSTSRANNSPGPLNLLPPVQVQPMLFEVLFEMTLASPELPHAQTNKKLPTPKRDFPVDQRRVARQVIWQTPPVCPVAV